MEIIVLYIVRWMDDTYYFSTWEKAADFLRKESFLKYSKEKEMEWLKNSIIKKEIEVY